MRRSTFDGQDMKELRKALALLLVGPPQAFGKAEVGVQDLRKILKQLARLVLKLRRQVSLLRRQLERQEERADRLRGEMDSLLAVFADVGLLGDGLVEPPEPQRPEGESGEEDPIPPPVANAKLKRLADGRGCLWLGGGSPVELPPRLRQFIEVLLDQSGSDRDGLFGWVSLEEIVAQMAKTGPRVRIGTVRRWVERIRKRLRRAGYAAKLIETKHGAVRLRVKSAGEPGAATEGSNRA